MPSASSTTPMTAPVVEGNTPGPRGRFADRLAAAIDKAGAPACVGLDPVVEKLPETLRRQFVGRAAGSAQTGHGEGDVAAVAAFCEGVIDAVAGIIPVIKPQAACFERLGAPGVALLHRLIERAVQRGIVVILDAKRGDIGVTAEHYAAAAFDGPHAADACTVSGYLGPDTIRPMMRPDRGVFVLVRTSNPESDAVQSLRLADGRTIAEMMADLVAAEGAGRVGARGLSDVGAVVGATKAAEGEQLRARMPQQYFLVPGFGAQGGTLDDVRRLVRAGARSPGELGVVVNASRSVLYPAGSASSGDWQDAVRAAAVSFKAELAKLI